MSFAQLTPEEIAELQSKINTLEPMNMALFNQKFKLIDENYPLTLPPWAILGGQIVSGTFILIEISLMAWFCLNIERVWVHYQNSVLHSLRRYNKILSSLSI